MFHVKHINNVSYETRKEIIWAELRVNQIKYGNYPL